MKFYGPPNQLIRTQKRRPMTMELYTVPLFRFDEKGEYETQDIKMAKKLMKRFEHDDAPIYKCKKCEYETMNKGEFAIHCRHKHPRPIYDDEE